MAPAVAEMLEALGSSDRVVGVGDFVSDASTYARLPRVGAYNAPNVERILELRADLFLTSASEAATSAHRRLESFGVRVVALDTSTYDGVLEALTELGRRLGREAAARRLAGETQGRLQAIRRTAAGLPRRRVLFVVGRDPLYVAGPGSHVDEMIQLAGGVNVLHDAASPYQRASMEAVLERMPEVIVDTSSNREGAPRGRFPGDWGRWDFLPAVRDERVYWVAPSRLVIPGIRLPEMTELMAKLIHPEAFGEASDAELAEP
jgi:iron complex transport system substrate-binding protein